MTKVVRTDTIGLSGIVAVGLLALAIGSAACGVPTTSSPTAVAGVPALLDAKTPPHFTHLPSGLPHCKASKPPLQKKKTRPLTHTTSTLATSPTTSTTAPKPAPSCVITDIYFVAAGENVLIGVPSSAPPTAAALLRALVAGPSRADSANGIITEIPAGAEASIVQVKGAKRGVVTVNLNASFGDMNSLPVAQIVCTLMNAHGVKGVLFYQFGGPASAPTGVPVADGYTSAPLTEGNYNNCSAA